MANVYVRSGAAGTGTGADWANAFTTLAAALTAKAAGDDFWLSEDHAESTAGAVTLTSPGTAASPCRIVCVNHAGSVPPVSADLRTTATVTATVNNNVSFAGFAYCYGVTFTAGNSTGNPLLNFTSTSAWLWEFDHCTLAVGSSGTGTLKVGETGGAKAHRFLALYDSTVSFNGSGSSIQANCAMLWRGGSLSCGSTTTLFGGNSGFGAARCDLFGVDLSAVTAGGNLVTMTSPFSDVYTLTDCKLGSSVSVATGSVVGQGGAAVRLVNCDSANTNYRYYKQTYQGTITQESTIVRSGGATDGTTAISRKMVTTANSKLYSPLESDWIYFWANTTGSTTVSVYTVTENVTLTTADADVQVEYLGTSGFPLGLFATSGVADVLASGSNYSTDTSTWTTTGLVTPVKQVMAVTFTTTGKGLCRARVRLSKASATVYFDPLVLSGSGRQYQAGEQYANEGPAGGGAGMLFVPNLDGV